MFVSELYVLLIFDFLKNFDDRCFIDVPNAGRKLVTLDKRLQWNPKFQEFVKDLDSKKPVGFINYYSLLLPYLIMLLQVIICGDMNVAHQEIGRPIHVRMIFNLYISFFFLCRYC